MNKLFICFILFSVKIISQSYLNTLYINGHEKTAYIGLIEKISFSSSGENIKYYFKLGITETEKIDKIEKITFGDSHLKRQFLDNLISLINILIVNEKFKDFLITKLENILIAYDKGDLNEVINVLNIAKNYVNELITTGKLSLEQGEFLITCINQIISDLDNGNLTTNGSEIIAATENETIKSDSYNLSQNYPNPFNPITTIYYTLQNDGQVTLKVYDVLGNEVAVLVNEFKHTGSYQTRFNGSNFASGIYFCRISIYNYSSLIKMILVK